MFRGANRDLVTRKVTMEDRALVVEPITELSVRSRIYTVRGVHVMLAHDLADIYQVSTSVFNQAVKRNEERFPENFRFQLTKAELDEVITICDNPDRLRFSPALPYAFTEQGIAMLSGVLKSDVAVQVSIRLMNTFVAMRRTLASIAPLLTRIETAERRQIMDQAKNDANQVRNEERFKLILDAMQDKKAEKVVSLDLRPVGSAIADYFMVCNGTNTTQVAAIADNIIKEAKEQLGMKPIRTQGFENNYWIIIDFGHIVIHVFLGEYRDFYRLEDLWADAPRKEYKERKRPVKKTTTEE